MVQTPGSLNFVGRATFEGITGAPVLVDEFEPDPARGAYPGDPQPEHAPISHLELVRRADAYAIVPATANTLAKLAAGLADNMLTSAALACTAPLIVAPAMNDKMYEHPATRANLAKLAERGVQIVAPGTGALASKGEWGVGRLAEPAEIAAVIEQALSGADYAPRSLDGLRVLVTAGGTREPIDAVRYVGNRSSGRMGFALADEAARRGAEVTVVAANVALPRSDGVRYVEVETAAELERAAREAFKDADVLLMAAAVADFRPAHPESSKISKSGRDGLTVELEPTADVLAALASERRPGQTVVGFAAEHGEGGPGARPRQARAQGPRRYRPERRVAAGNRLRLARERGLDRHPGRRPAGAAGPQDGRGAGDHRGGGEDPLAGESRGEGDVSEREQTPEERGEKVYDLFTRGSALLESGDFNAAAIPLEQARSLEPDKSSIREALGRAYFHAGRYAQAGEEFAAVVERHPVNDFAHFCLGRSLEKTGRITEARRHLALATSLRPDRADYRVYRARIEAA